MKGRRPLRLAGGVHVEIAGNYKRYTRENGNADRYGGELKFSFLNNSVRSGVSYYYLRAEQADHHIGWTSPVWVSP